MFSGNFLGTFLHSFRPTYIRNSHDYTPPTGTKSEGLVFKVTEYSLRGLDLFRLVCSEICFLRLTT